ncbi:MAG: hypothetical protein N2043_08230 [Ignavibacterium sp.]|nr:hypothetical protein [Ignavibacterium sp.]
MCNKKTIKMQKTIILTSLAILALISFVGFTTKINGTSNECEIKNFYVAISPKNRDTKVLTKIGNLEEVDLILVPTKLETGKYKVNLTRKGLNIYKVESTEFWIETWYCYEYAFWEEVILIVESSYGYTKGKIIFD